MTRAQKIGSAICGIGVYVAFLLLPTVLFLLVQIFIPGWSEAALQFLQNGSTILTAGILLLLYRLAGVKARESVGFCPREVPAAVHGAAFAFGLLGNFAVSFVMNLLPAGWLASYAEQSAGIYDAGQPFWSIVAVVIFAPVGEELLFRGMIYRSFRKAMPFWAAAVLSALLFGVAHLHPVWIAYAFGMGFCFAVMVNRTGSLSVSILAHVGFNLASLPSLLLTEDSLWFRLVYGSIGGYLLLHGLCIAGCVFLWVRFFSKSSETMMFH